MVSADAVDRIIQDISTTDHILLFYDTQKSKRRILFSYLAEGLRQGKGVVYVRAEETPQDVIKGLASYGIDVGPDPESRNIFTPGYDEFYIVDGKVEAPKILGRWHELISHFQSKGLGLRAAGETSCFFKEGKVRELLRYEYSLHRALFVPMDVICAYNLKTIVDTGYTDIIMPLVRAHGKAIFTAEGGTIVLEPENVEDTDVERLLEITI